MTSQLDIRAGAQAIRHIRENGLSADGISAVFGASGSAKWLAIYGLDAAIFGTFLTSSRHTIALYGTSIGAFKLAAAAQFDPVSALRSLALMYIEQSYKGEISPEAIAAETNKIVGAILTDRAIDEILTHPSFRFHCGAIQCHGRLASPRSSDQRMALIQAFVFSLMGRSKQKKFFSRAVFHDPRSEDCFPGNDAFATSQIPLTPDNFKQALIASGSLPVYMHGVETLAGDSTKTVYRDGGLLDYHPVPSSLSPNYKGVVLYPHFYPYLKEGWFDKMLPWRNVRPDRLDQIVLIAPNKQFVASLPNQRIPDRQDFYRYADDSPKRQGDWLEAMTRSEELGQEFLDVALSGNIADMVRPFED